MLQADAHCAYKVFLTLLSMILVRTKYVPCNRVSVITEHHDKNYIDISIATTSLKLCKLILQEMFVSRIHRTHISHISHQSKSYFNSPTFITSSFSQLVLLTSRGLFCQIHRALNEFFEFSRMKACVRIVDIFIVWFNNTPIRVSIMVHEIWASSFQCRTEFFPVHLNKEQLFTFNCLTLSVLKLTVTLYKG